MWDIFRYIVIDLIWAICYVNEVAVVIVIE